MKGRGLHVYALCYLLFLYAPILLLPIFAFNSGTVIAFPLKGVTTEWFARRVEGRYKTCLGRSGAQQGAG